MSSSSSSSRSNSRTTLGIPTRCWCGSKLTTFGAQTKENLYRRFYRCEIGVKKQSEHHLFKWIDEAIIDEINMLDSKQCQLQVDVQTFKNTMTQRLQDHGKHIDEALLEMKRFMHDQTAMLAEIKRCSTQDNATPVTEASLASLTNATYVTKSPSTFSTLLLQQWR
uniref:GRF-type domain-containing protein n=1 Tax=Brassica oleracea var. oleracea TaxID=109376 RepID=A0A0D2ZR97_BRAOL